MTIEQIAQICHEANKGLCEATGDNSQKSWNYADQWQRDSAIKGVQFAIDNPNAEADAQHNAWLSDKEKDGWKYGPIKDPDKKEHPCFVPYDQLPEEQQAKDHLFKAIVNSLSKFIN